jgi:hypothetical protein
VDHDWSFELRGVGRLAALVWTSVTEVESLGKVEVELEQMSA